MSTEPERALVEGILRRNRYLVLATTDGEVPWVAPLEYMLDDELNFYFLSTDDSRHVRDLTGHSQVAVAVFEHEQGEYSPDASLTLNGVQMEAVVHRVAPEDYTDDVNAAIAALDPPMPPYAVFKIEARRFYLPKVADGVNVRTEVMMRDDS